MSETGSVATKESLPRWSVAALSALVGAVLCWAAWLLPWREWTPFALVTWLVAAVHVATAVAMAAGSESRGKVWRVQALVALAYQVWLTWSVVRSAAYVAAVYGSMGEGIAAGLMAVLAVLALLMVPTSVWALAVTGGIRPGRRGKGAAVLGVVLAAWGLQRAAAAAEFDVRVGDSQAELRSLLDRTITAPEPTERETISLHQREAVQCATPPTEARVTIVTTFVGRDPADRPTPTSRCLQADDVDTALAALNTMLVADALPGAVKIDILTGLDPLTELMPVVDTISLRPGLDGVCEGTRCLMPWQLFSEDAFGGNIPFPTIPDFRFGFDPTAVRLALTWPDRPERRPSPSVEGLVRVSTASFVRTPDGQVHSLRRLRTEGPELNAASLSETMRGAERYILDSQQDDGRYAYMLHPMTGQVQMAGFNLARQAGTTLVVCELAEDRERAREVATKAIEMMVSAGTRSGEVMALVWPVKREHRFAALGNTALASIAMLSCRDLVGDRFDDDIAAMTRFLLAMQRADGGFNPRFDLQAGAPVPGPDPLFAVGQAVFALSLLERLVTVEDLPQLPAREVVREAVERSMTYTAEDFWDHFGRDFFWVEENWHCLAARASLGHHRHEGYERFCIDYATFKARLVLDEDSDVDPDYVGGVNVGNLNPPATTPTSGLAEALAAAAGIARFRGEDTAVFERALKLALPFVMHQQWRPESCFACTTKHTVVGAFSESMGAPQIRIDYVQHAMASLGHGGRILGLVPGTSVPPPVE